MLTNEEHIKLRINRVLWSYEAESQTDVQSQMPLVSPKYVKVLAEILDCELVTEPFMVRTLKTFLKARTASLLEEAMGPKWQCFHLLLGSELAYLLATVEGREAGSLTASEPILSDSH
ncbi:unnamed protein product [Effrenium voratum]|nr:unnamed protein product [Effrenium voratum]